MILRRNQQNSNDTDEQNENFSSAHFFFVYHLACQHGKQNGADIQDREKQRTAEPTCRQSVYHLSKTKNTLICRKPTNKGCYFL